VGRARPPPHPSGYGALTECSHCMQRACSTSGIVSQAHARVAAAHLVREDGPRVAVVIVVGGGGGTWGAQQ